MIASRIEPAPRAARVTVPRSRQPDRRPVLVRVDRRRPGAPVVRMHGVVDRSGTGPARAAMQAALADAPPAVLVDLRGVTTMDGSGAVLLAAMARHARRLGAEMRVTGARPAVRAVMRARQVENLLAG